MSLLLFVAAGFTQQTDLPPLNQEPERIEFADPKEVDNLLDEVQEYETSFPSPLTSGHPENDVIPVRLVLPKEREGRIPTVIVLHYWGASDLRFERTTAYELARRGIASAIVVLPYHLERTPKGTRSGQYSVRPDPELLKQSMTQSVLDVRRVLHFLETRPELDSSRIGILGTSLGSIVAANVYAVEPKVKAASFLLGGIDLAHILWHSSRVVKERDALRAKGFTESRLRESLEPIEPTGWLTQRKDGKSFVVGGRYDTVIPPVDTQKLINALPDTQSLMLDTGHYGGIFIQKRIMNTSASFFEDVFANRTFVAPKSIYAPTLRIVAAASTESRLDVGIGVDLFSTPRRDAFGTFLVTPKGPKLFLGGQLDKNIAIGIFGTTNKAGVGLLWSTVL